MHIVRYTSENSSLYGNIPNIWTLEPGVFWSKLLLGNSTGDLNVAPVCGTQWWYTTVCILILFINHDLIAIVNGGQPCRLD